MFNYLLRSFIFLLLFALLGITTFWISAANAATPLVANSDAVLPVSATEVQQTLQQLHDKFIKDTAGADANYIPELAKIKPDQLGIAIVTVDGRVFTVGDAEKAFAIESISKPFVYGLALQDHGREVMQKKVGVEATGLPFNSIIASDVRATRLQNPFVNAGAIATTSLIKGNSSNEKWDRVVAMFGDYIGHKPQLSLPIYRSESETNSHNHALDQLLLSYKLMYGDPNDALDRYTRACSLLVTAKDLATMGATLANGGINPMTKKNVLQPEYVTDILSMMLITGFYDQSGDWMMNVGLPGKSGVGGGVLAVVPHRFAIAVFSPRLDQQGNSVRGIDVVKALSKQWHLHMFYMQPRT